MRGERLEPECRLTRQLVDREAADYSHRRFELGVEDERQMRAIGFTLWRLFRLNVETRFPIRVVGMVCEVTVCEHAPIVRLIVRDAGYRVPRLPPLCREVRIDPPLVQEVMNLDLAAIMVVDAANNLMDEFARVSAKTHWDRAKLPNL